MITPKQKTQNFYNRVKSMISNRNISTTNREHSSDGSVSRTIMLNAAASAKHIQLNIHVLGVGHHPATIQLFYVFKVGALEE